MGRLYFFVIAIGLAVGLLMPASFRSGESSGPVSSEAPQTRVVDAPRYANQMVPSRLTGNAGGATILSRGEGGHFFAEASVNGMSVNFLVDTGATGVALTTQDAQRIGLVFAPSEFSVIGSGASGPVRGKLIVLDRVAMGGKTVEQVPGAILEHAEMSLLGQSFLARMGKIEIEGDEMVIR